MPRRSLKMIGSFLAIVRYLWINWYLSTWKNCVVPKVSYYFSPSMTLNNWDAVTVWALFRFWLSQISIFSSNEEQMIWSQKFNWVRKGQTVLSSLLNFLFRQHHTFSWIVSFRSRSVTCRLLPRVTSDPGSIETKMIMSPIFDLTLYLIYAFMALCFHIPLVLPATSFDFEPCFLQFFILPEGLGTTASIH